MSFHFCLQSWRTQALLTQTRWSWSSRTERFSAKKCSRGCQAATELDCCCRWGWKYQWTWWLSQSPSREWRNRQKWRESRKRRSEACSLYVLALYWSVNRDYYYHIMSARGNWVSRRASIKARYRNRRKGQWHKERREKELRLQQYIDSCELEDSERDPYRVYACCRLCKTRKWVNPYSEEECMCPWSCLNAWHEYGCHCRLDPKTVDRRVLLVSDYLKDSRVELDVVQTTPTRTPCNCTGREYRFVFYSYLNCACEKF